MRRDFNRYIVFKANDTIKYLTDTEQGMLELLVDEINYYRETEGGKTHPLTCVVIEEDWPEYEKVWNLLEERVDHPNTPA